MRDSLEGHTKLAWWAGFNDTRAKGEFKLHHTKCGCLACQTAYGKGSDAAIRQMIFGKR
jgi:hypothetical protein